MPISIYGENNPGLRAYMPAGNATVWRYTDLGKYLDLIRKCARDFQTRAARAGD